MKKPLGGRLRSVPGVTAGSFVGKGKGTPETDGGVKLTRLPVSAATGAVLAHLNNNGVEVPLCAAAWKGKPADVAAALANPQAHAEFWTDVLFNGTGTRFRKDYPNYYVASMTVLSTVQPSKVAGELSKGISDALGSVDAATKTTIERGTAVLAKSMNLGPDTKFLRLHWDNQDDCSFTGLVAADPKSGQLRMVGYYNEP